MTKIKHDLKVFLINGIQHFDLINPPAAYFGAIEEFRNLFCTLFQKFSSSKHYLRMNDAVENSSYRITR